MDAADARRLRCVQFAGGNVLAALQEQSDATERGIVACAAESAHTSGPHVLPDKPRGFAERHRAD